MNVPAGWTRIAALLLLFAPAACSKQQLSHFAHDLCKGLSHCSVYDADGEPSQGWDPWSRPERDT
jgi:hypothetical protein